MLKQANRNLLAAILIIAGAVLVAVSPVSADGEVSACTDFSYDFDALGQGPLTKNQPTLGPVTVAVAVGTYDIVLTSSDPTHAAGAYTDQLHESWFLVTDSGFTSPVTPDIADADSSITISVAGVDLGVTTQLTAVWAGQAPSFDSVHPSVTFLCAEVAETTTTTTTTTLPTTEAPTTTVQTATTAVGTASTVASTTTTTVAATTTSTIGAAGNPTVVTTTTLSAAAQTEGAEEDSAEELAYTGIKINLALAGISLIVAGAGLIIGGSYYDRRKLALARVHG